MFYKSQNKICNFHGNYKRTSKCLCSALRKYDNKFPVARLITEQHTHTLDTVNNEWAATHGYVHTMMTL